MHLLKTLYLVVMKYSLFNRCTSICSAVYCTSSTATTTTTSSSESTPSSTSASSTTTPWTFKSTYEFWGQRYCIVQVNKPNYWLHDHTEIQNTHFRPEGNYYHHILTEHLLRTDLIASLNIVRANIIILLL